MAGRGRGRRARRLLEGVRVGGVVWHERLAVQGGAAELGQQAELGVIFTVPWHQHRRQHWRLYPAIVVRVDAHLLLLGAKWELTALQRLQLMVGLEIRPAPHSAINDVGQTLAVGHLQPPVQRPGDGDALAGLPGTAERPLQLVHGAFLLL